MAKKDFSFDGGKTFDWEGYLRHRPDYNLSNFYEMIWNYHSKYGNGKQDLAYDVGCGPGQVSKAVIEKGGFARVKATDPNADNVNAARTYLKTLSDRVEFQVCKAEEVGQEDAGKVDLITGGMCLHLTDHKKAIENFSKLLAPGGTLAVWIYGGLIFTDDDGAGIEKLHRTLLSKLFDEFKPFKGTHWESGMNMFFAWMDNVELSTDSWRNVQRVKWNREKSLLCFLDESDVDYEIKYENKVSKDDTVDHRTDSSFWATEVDYAWCVGELKVGLPGKKEPMTDEVKELYTKLEQAMAGKTWKVTFPVALILATKK